MKKILFFAIVTGIAWLANAQSSRDSAAIEKIILDFQKDFNDGTFKNAIHYTTPDWEHINPLGGIDKGRDQVLKVVRSVHQSFLKGVTMKIKSMSVRFIVPTVAIADVIHEIDAYITPDGVHHNSERQIKTYVLVNQNQTWFLTHDHNTIIQPINQAGK